MRAATTSGRCAAALGMMLLPRAARALSTPAATRVDLRSDTVTKPTPAMYEAMTTADVGDDVFGDDPTVNALERRVARMFGKEEAVFVPTGTMANLIAVMAHTWERGSEYIVGDRAHIFLYEQGGGAQLGGAHPRTVPTATDGTLGLDDLRAAIRAKDVHCPVTKLICLENTHNVCGGRVLAPPYMDSVGALAAERGLALHVDGARIWNAMAALGVEGEALVRTADSAAVCLSKGLGAPAGSLFVASHDLCARARRLRKALGGGWRQAGVLAAAGLHALDHRLPRLGEDHARATELAAGVSRIPGLRCDLSSVETNILFFDVDEGATVDAAALVAACAARGVEFLAFGERRCRCVTHLHVTADGVEYALDCMRAVMEAA